MNRGLPRRHWLVLAVVLLALIAVLAVHGYSMLAAGRTGTSWGMGTFEGVPADIYRGGPGIDLTRDQISTSRPRPGTVALTFDDGPDPMWTPAILAVLAKKRVPATFFMVGSNVAAHPEVARAVHEGGHEIAVHTFTHPDLSGMAAWRIRMELAATQLAVAAATGVATPLFRPPFSATSEAVDSAAWRTIQVAGASGYQSVLTTHDSLDWLSPGTAEIVLNSTPQGTDGAVVLMHDGGGDRSQTVVAVELLIDQLAARGYRFATVSEALRLARPAPAPALWRWQGHALTSAVHVAALVSEWLRWMMIFGAILLIVRMVALTIGAFVHSGRRHRWTQGPIREPVSVIIPAYNEVSQIEATLRSLQLSDHRPLEVIVVDDGSEDGTADLVEDLRIPGVQLLRQPKAGKAAALNLGLAHASHQIIVLMDADTVFAASTITALLRPFADPRIGAVSGNTKVANPRRLLGRWQHIEYVMGFNLDRRLFDLARCMPTIPGAVGAYRRAALTDVGGVSDSTLAEDTDLTMALGRAGWSIVYEPDARAWTDAPATLAQFWQQRYRWCYGTLQSMWKHRAGVLSTGPGGRWARRAMLYLTAFHVLLPLLAPMLDIFLIYGLINGNADQAVVIWLSFLVAQTAQAAYAFRLDGERLGPLWTLPLLPFAYRPILCLAVIQSIVTALTGAPMRWHQTPTTSIQRIAVGVGSR